MQPGDADVVDPLARRRRTPGRRTRPRRPPARPTCPAATTQTVPRGSGSGPTATAARLVVDQASGNAARTAAHRLGRDAGGERRAAAGLGGEGAQDRRRSARASCRRRRRPRGHRCAAPRWVSTRAKPRSTHSVHRRRRRAGSSAVVDRRPRRHATSRSSDSSLRTVHAVQASAGSLHAGPHPSRRGQPRALLARWTPTRRSRLGAAGAPPASCLAAPAGCVAASAAGAVSRAGPPAAPRRRAERPTSGARRPAARCGTSRSFATTRSATWAGGCRSRLRCSTTTATAWSSRSINGRSETRTYAKGAGRAAQSDHSLSPEEKQAIATARRTSPRGRPLGSAHAWSAARPLRLPRPGRHVRRGSAAHDPGREPRSTCSRSPASRPRSRRSGAARPTTRWCRSRTRSRVRCRRPWTSWRSGSR